ncbi:MAG: NADH-quinone oxidoreductase subunit C [Oscillospiraceae bacterium]|jgi:ech hydrogenase subunit D|nr:NADH-quinone oxidoreductase subunit C [Oscillospiraceae bacterium]MCI1991161.1 NADH-quinone oxidoreductase subunit C [Oscillospiraceae bacterium]MCI2035402.1 NADH-quinone oxidoreductase subunit C [Oscillospiraceae bacterium]
MAETKLVAVDVQNLLEEATKLKSGGYRLVQMCSTRVKDGNELTYSFGKGYDLLHLRFTVGDSTQVESISHIFPPAYFYENEIHDLFGVPIEFMTVDFKGNLYRTAEKTPFKGGDSQ